MLTVDPDEPLSDVPSPEGAGLDQGAKASLSETLTVSGHQGRREARARATGLTVLRRFFHWQVRRSSLRHGSMPVLVSRRVGGAAPSSRRAGIPLVEPPPPVRGWPI